MTKDHCTMFPDGPWRGCCEIHDLAYAGATGKTRAQADKELYECVKNNGHPVIAGIMYAGVRAFGWMFFRKTAQNA